MRLGHSSGSGLFHINVGQWAAMALRSGPGIVASPISRRTVRWSFAETWKTWQDCPGFVLWLINCGVMLRELQGFSEVPIFLHLSTRSSLFDLLSISDDNRRVFPLLEPQAF